MVSPVNTNSTAGLNSLLRTQTSSNVTQIANRQATQQTYTGPKAASTQAVSKTDNADKLLDLASANGQSSPNLPRGSIVDKLV